MKTKHLGVVVSTQILKPKFHDNCLLMNVDIFQIAIMTKLIPTINYIVLRDLGPLYLLTLSLHSLVPLSVSLIGIPAVF